MWDTQCSRLVCLLCLSTTHHGHKGQDIAEAGRAVRHELEARAREATDKCKRLDEASRAVQRRKQEVQEQAQAIQRQIADGFQQVFSFCVP